MGPDQQRVAVIVNPRSANGQTSRNWPTIQSKLSRVWSEIGVMQTESPGHAIGLSGEAVRSGYNTIIAVGGDGTLNETVNGILAQGATDSIVTLGLIPQGRVRTSAVLQNFLSTKTKQSRLSKGAKLLCSMRCALFIETQVESKVFATPSTSRALVWVALSRREPIVRPNHSGARWLS